jgi:endonuclease-3 related protein
LGIEDKDTAAALIDIYNRLFDRYGPQSWWPADSPFEVVVGAILTQSAAWTNVEQAISNLKRENALTPEALHTLPVERLALLIRPSGYFNAKALKLKAFAERLHSRYNGDLGRLFTLDTALLRQELLSIHGVGEETADSIMLYAARRPSFVIDAYTKRIVSRLGLAPPKDGYRDFQALFAHNLPQDERLFNEYHALLVRHGKEVCRKAPDCPRCCLGSICPQEVPHLRS